MDQGGLRERGGGREGIIITIIIITRRVDGRTAAFTRGSEVDR
jgi:hypothetical protein